MCREPVSIKSFAVKEKQEVQVTTRFLTGKMLMFAKLSLMSFTYELLETFCFQDEKVKENYEKYLIEKVYMYHILTNTKSTSLQILFVSDSAGDIIESKYRELIFEVIGASKIYNNFDTSNEFWAKFGFQKPSLYKYLVYFSVENIDNLRYLTIAFNPKEYFKMFKNNLVKKKHKEY